MRQVKAVELRAFLLDRLGLLGPLWTADAATAGARVADGARSKGRTRARNSSSAFPTT